MLPGGTPEVPILEAHIVECKKTVDSKKWEEALNQMSWTLVRLQALAGALGADLAGAVFYTAVREDKLSEDESPNPAYPERLVGGPGDDAEAALDWGRRKQLDWMRGRIRFREFGCELAHHQIRLDENGRGRAALAIGAR